MDVQEVQFLLLGWQSHSAPAGGGGRRLAQKWDGAASRKEKWDCVPAAAEKLKTEGALCWKSPCV